MLRRLRIAIVALMVTAVLAPMAAASSARVRTLGGVHDLLEDDTGVVRWPGALIDYTDLATLALGDWAHDLDGAARDHVAGRGGTVHVALDRRLLGLDAAGLQYGEDLAAPDPGGWIQMMIARGAGPVDLGLAFRATSHSEASGRHDEPLTGDSRFLHALVLGARWDVGDRTYVDLALEGMDSEVDHYRRDQETPVVEENLRTARSWGARARGFHQLTDRLVWVGRLGWYRDRRPVTDDVFDDLVDYEGDHFRGGFGFHVMPDPDNLIVVTGDYRRLEDERQARHPFQARWETGWREWWRIDARVGIESRVSPWLTVRASATYRRHVDDGRHEYRWSEDFVERAYDYQVRVDTPITVGVGLHLGQFDCDIVANATAPFEVGQTTAGIDDGAATNLTGVTLRYAW
ncbi:hypothetical protein GF314_12400 [bacterium]|nr:hypothetical protein [bacterium]